MKQSITNDETIQGFNVKVVKKKNRKRGHCFRNQFSSSRIPFVAAFMFCSPKELNFIKCFKKHINMGDNATIDLNSYMRKVYT